MNWSVCGADATTHLKIVATALFAAITVVWVGMAAHMTSTPLWSAPMPAKAIAVLNSARF